MNFVRGERRAAIHVVEIVIGGMRKLAAVRPASFASSNTAPGCGFLAQPAATMASKTMIDDATAR